MSHPPSRTWYLGSSAPRCPGWRPYPFPLGRFAEPPRSPRLKEKGARSAGHAGHCSSVRVDRRRHGTTTPGRPTCEVRGAAQIQRLDPRRGIGGGGGVQPASCCAAPSSSSSTEWGQWLLPCLTLRTSSGFDRGSCLGRASQTALESNSTNAFSVRDSDVALEMSNPPLGSLRAMKIEDWGCSSMVKYCL